ncbi:acyl-CoA/acyl-ACP dehydrogenase [Bradyrhizobium sp. IC3069]|uniref:acyl-CoA dehydrogenase family protein n=1 Tax=Bradyrhizobium TaxID=374 RepID=UPI001CD3765F|nr:MULTISPECIES: acyl-CoA dehydrogenase family protein [Bradyrhizobium]MCA1360889.1 acyl-CoA/acyl-ACP dehydrogenase [Bradyrhizobium sp. IC4059]MCA1411928.1 acyl-CoA/acyl-ACP dehydrogenase [Bradyrhizobium sp. NBAIM20]MCA1460840.1 acyl-CoA/acyl-ACP dehydrogenase [Bradyrhizobium sp. NBAIM18]MCA1518310.1 acyl-CoA/acyl-ACP dehydrogenase [Bradyrhizobium sp. IC3069]MCA1529662.1 acyl-CoA/acyl-ACP dehydrogenase [Bradyrhizobium yuanmingense]
MKRGQDHCGLMAMYTQVYAQFGETQERLAEGHATARYSSFIAELSQLNFADADDRRAFPPTLHSILARHGLFGLTAPGEHGGLALSLQEAIDLISATASFDVSAASTLVIHNFLALPCIEAASHIPAQAHIIRGATSGDLCAFALTEPGAGSAPRHIEAAAFMHEDKVRISGRKIWIGLADWARWIVCFARASGPDAKGRLVGVLVDRQAPGLKVTHEHRTLGLRGIIQNTLEFQDVEMPRSYVLSRDQDGWGAAASSMNRGRIGVAAMGLGALERAIQVAASYASHRRLGKLRMIENSYIEQLFGQMVLRREVVKAMLAASCRLVSAHGAPNVHLASATKVLSSEWCGLVADQCVQLLGGRGYDEGTPLAKIYRDARILRIFEGPTEALLSHLGRCLLSKATRDEIADLFRSIGAASVHAAAIDELSGLNETDGAVLIYAGWLTTLGLAKAVMSADCFSASDCAAAAADLVSSELTSLRTRVPARQSVETRSRANRTLATFLHDAACSIRSPVLTDDYLKLVQYV